MVFCLVVFQPGVSDLLMIVSNVNAQQHGGMSTLMVLNCYHSFVYNVIVLFLYLFVYREGGRAGMCSPSSERRPEPSAATSALRRALILLVQVDHQLFAVTHRHFQCRAGNARLLKNSALFTIVFNADDDNPEGRKKCLLHEFIIA